MSGGLLCNIPAGNFKGGVEQPWENSGKRDVIFEADDDD